MGFFEKRKFRNFLIFLSTYEKDKPSTWIKGKVLSDHLEILVIIVS
jgi:hypothetical protein